MIYGIIYKLIFSNGKIYVGQTTASIKVRIKRHIKDANNKKSGVYNSKLGRAIRKYKKFEYIVIKKDVPERGLNDLETNEIEKNNSYKVGYNSTLGGAGTRGWKHSKKAKKKIAQATKECWENGVFKTKANAELIGIIREKYKTEKFSMAKVARDFPNLAYNTVVDILKNNSWYDKEYQKFLDTKQKMTFKKAKEIRKKYISGSYYYIELSKIYGLSLGAIGNIITNKSWYDSKFNTTKCLEVSRKNKISNTKINFKIAEQIRKQHKRGTKGYLLAEKYNLSVGSVSGIINNKIWKTSEH